MAKPAISQLQHDDERMRVTLWTLPPGTETGWHLHAMDYVVVPVAGGLLTVDTGQEGRKSYPIETGKSYVRSSGVEHNILNETGAEIAFVEIELKAPAAD